MKKFFLGKTSKQATSPSAGASAMSLMPPDIIVVDTDLSRPLEWGPDELLERARSEELSGLCNALTGAYLAGCIEPQEGKLGITESNYKQIKLLKQMLDAIVKDDYSESASPQTTLAFIDYIKSKSSGNNWLAALSLDTVDSEYESFMRYKRDWEDSANIDEFDIIEDDLNTNITREKIFTKLNPLFEGESGCQGLIELKATCRDNTQTPAYLYYAGHEIGFKYLAGGSIFQIFDQNRGLTLPRSTYQPRSFVEMICEYIYSVYVQNPMVGDLILWPCDTVPPDQPEHKLTDHIRITLHVRLAAGK